MTQADAASRLTADHGSQPAFRPLRLLIRVVVTTAVIGGVIGWSVLHGHAAPGSSPLAELGPPPSFHLHAPRFELLAAAPMVIRLHVAAAVSAFVIGCILLAGVKGTTLHKALGWTWVAAMMVTALSSFFIKVVNPGHWSLIHVLSGWVAIGVPMGIAAIRRGNVRAHRRMMTGQFIGGLLIAGVFTLAPGRLMFQVFFG